MPDPVADTSQPQDEGRLNADTPYPYTRPQDEELRHKVAKRVAMARTGYTGWTYHTDYAIADAVIPLVAKAQRADDVEWLTPALSGAPAYRDLLRALAARPLISEEGATRGN